MSEPGASRTTDQRTITVVGEGLASTVPDTALLHLGVETRGATPWPGAGVRFCPARSRGEVSGLKNRKGIGQDCRNKRL